MIRQTTVTLAMWWVTAPLLGCASAVEPRPTAGDAVEPEGREMASVYVLLTPTGLSLQRVDTSGSALSTRVSGADGARLDQGYAVATDERGTDVLVVWYERTPQGTSLRVRRSRLGRILWSRHVEGPCAALDANGAVIPGGCAIGSTARAEIGR